jgi:plastocyanin
MPAIPIAAPRTARPLLPAVVAAVLLWTALAALIGPATVRAADAAVEITSTFGPATLTVTVGDTVTWTNADSMPHTASAEDGAFDSGNLDPGQAFSFTFTEPGTYEYRCDYHSDMQGTIVVEAAASEPSTAATATATPGATSGRADQPDTALPFEDDGPVPLARVLMGLGLVALAVGLVPIGLRRATPVTEARPRSASGWRR